MRTGWIWVDQGTDELHVYRQTGRPSYEIHGYRLNRCRWLYHVMRGDDFAGRREHEDLEAAMEEAEKMRERDQELIAKGRDLATIRRTPPRRRRPRRRRIVAY